MSGFSADWLALRAAADARARSAPLIAKAILAASRDGAPHVMDLGAGTGATMRALAPAIEPAHTWTLVDADKALLTEAQRLYSAAPMVGVGLSTLHHDLVASPVPWDAGAHRPTLVTASALFDLASQEFVTALAAACARERIPLLSMLSFDGVLELAPSHPFDGPMVEAFNRHQRGEKSFGRALGPDAVPALSAAFTSHGFVEDQASTPWVLEAGRDDALMVAMMDGWAGAGAEVLPSHHADIEDWLASRHTATERLVVGHRDQLFLPG
ncbi:MAG: class I SAM-dependent methyltransferase [Pseudomonadota bacterium]